MNKRQKKRRRRQQRTIAAELARWGLTLKATGGATHRRLGFPTYEAYLASPLWKSIRGRVYTEKWRVCECCGKPADVVHHRRYDIETMLGISLQMLSPLCHGCHEKVHQGGADEREADIRWCRMRETQIKPKPQKPKKPRPLPAGCRPEKRAAGWYSLS